MITPMKKLSIICLKTAREEALNRLQDLGLLHVTPCSDPTDSTLSQARQKVEEAKVAIATLECDEQLQHSHKNSCADGNCNIDSVISEIYKLHQSYRHKEEHLTNLRILRHNLRPYGNFKPETIQDLQKSGVAVRLYHTRDIENLEIPDGIQIHTLSQDKSGTYFAAISQTNFEIQGASEYNLPEKSLDEVQAEIDAMKHELETIRNGVCQFANLKDKLIETLHRREEAVSYAEVHDTLGTHGEVVYLKGFCPEDKVEKIKTVAREAGWGILIEEPGEDDNVPTLIKFPKWVTPAKALFQALSILPGYREADISSVFLIFFSLFFAILIGDAGYGLLFLLITIYARKKLKKAPAYPFILFGILSVGTIIWGTLTGNYFGINPKFLPPFIQGLQVDWLTGESGQNHIMKLCFLIGGIHLTIAHIWNIVVLAPNKKALAQLGWIGLVWCMYYTALNMVLQTPLPKFFTPLLIASAVTILLFMTAPKDLKKEWIHHVMFPLSMVNCFVDIVSYIRLFAVGLASLSVAMSFNNMAMQLGWQKIWTIPIMAIILLLGHGLNITLCALGILVHGVRLNTLEFSMHKELEWKGFPYKPFSRKKDSVA